MTDLLDINVLIALAWPNHVHHQLALGWFQQSDGRSWATTPVTEIGFVRVSSNRSAIPETVTPAEALALLVRMVKLPGHRFLPDDTPMVVGNHLDPQRVVTHRQVTDAHLLAVARRHQCRLATLDHGIVALSGGSESVVLLA